jgi:hypothetical protein
MTTPLQQLHKPIDLHKLPLPQARVEIAKDVLAAIDLGVLLPKAHNAYVFLSYKPQRGEFDLRKAFGKKLIKDCEVCGIGALFIAKVGRLDAVKAGGALGNARFDGDYVREQLLTFFSTRQLALIECAFEYDDGDHPRLTPDEVYNAVLFGVEHINERERMRAIMQNIIDNHGEFCP